MNYQTKLREYDELYDEAYYAWNIFYPLSERDLRFYLGDQWDEKEKTKLFEEGRSTFVFNQIRRTIDAISGYQRKNRLSSVVVPIENSDQLTADQLSQLLLYVMDSSDGYHVISDSFGGAIKTGWNLASLWMDYRDDPINGDIRFQREPAYGFITDPYFTRLDFSDCSYILRRKYLSEEQVNSLLPGHEKDIDQLYKIGWNRDDKFTWLPYQRQPNGQDMLAYNEMYLQKWRNVPMLVDMESGDFTDFDVDDDKLKLILKKYPQLKVVKKPKRYIERTIIINDEVFKVDENPYGLDEYPFVPFVAIFEPESSQWGLKMQSLIRNLIDPQKEKNRRRSQMVDLVDSQINSGWIADQDAVINPRSLFQSGQGKVVWRKNDSRPGAIEKIPPGQIPPSYFQLEEMFSNDITELAGINDAAFGMTESGNESGIMMMLRQGANLVNLQTIFDNLRLSQKFLSKKALKLIQQWTPSKVQRIINQIPTSQFYNQEFTKYDIAVREGVLTDTQQAIYFKQLVELKELGGPVTAEMLAKAAPMQGKSEYIKEIAELEKQQQAQAQKQQETQDLYVNAKTQADQARAISDIALSKERFTRAVANMGLEDERAARAVDDRSDAALNRVKAIKELQTLDRSEISDYLELIRVMEEMNRVQEEDIKMDDVKISAEGEQAQNQPNPLQLSNREEAIINAPGETPSAQQ